MQILAHIIRVLLGVSFVLSGLAKLFPIEPFEIIFVDLGVSNWVYAPFIARFIIAFEISLGLCIIFNVWLRNFIFRLTLASLILFTGYLVYLLIAKGNDVDCGCFGSWISLTPVQSIVKNVLLIVMLLLIYKRRYSYGVINWLVIPFLAIGFTSTFLLNRVGLQNVEGITLNETVDYSALPATYFTKEKINFNQGEKIVAFLSSSCSHCESAAHKLTYLKEVHEVDNLIVVLGSKKEENIQPFLDKTKLEYPTIWISGNEFFNYSGPRLPAIVYLKDGKLKKKWTGEFFRVEELEAILKD